MALYLWITLKDRQYPFATYSDPVKHVFRCHAQYLTLATFTFEGRFAASAENLCPFDTTNFDDLWAV